MSAGHVKQALFFAFGAFHATGNWFRRVLAPAPYDYNR
jgi:hypothetical protein